jgi:hypothetical protein
MQASDAKDALPPCRMWRQSGRRLRQFGQKRVGLSKNSDYWLLGILEGASILGPLIHDGERKNGNINIRVNRIIQRVPTARVGGRRTARISAL